MWRKKSRLVSDEDRRWFVLPNDASDAHRPRPCHQNPGNLGSMSKGEADFQAALSSTCAVKKHGLPESDNLRWEGGGLSRALSSLCILQAVQSDMGKARNPQAQRMRTTTWRFMVLNNQLQLYLITSYNPLISPLIGL